MTTTTAPIMPPCKYCGQYPNHPPEQCNAVKSVEYYPNGQIKRVEKQGDAS